jgi:hypothetical protein
LEQNEKPYRKFFRGKDLCLNRPMSARVVKRRTGILPVSICVHLRSLASPKSDEGGQRLKRKMIMKTRHGKIARLPKEIREQLNRRL